MKSRKKKVNSFTNAYSVIISAVVVFILIFWFGSSFIEILRLNQQKSDLIAQISEKEEINSQLNDDIEQIGTKSYIERIARNYLNLYYPDEQIVIPVESTPVDSNEEQENPAEEENSSEETDVYGPEIITQDSEVEANE